MKRRCDRAETQIDQNPLVSKLQNDSHSILSLDPIDHKRGEGLRGEPPSPREIQRKRKSISSEEYISVYDYRTDPLILRDLLKKLRRENPKVSILNVHHYPLYSPYVKIYKIRNRKYQPPGCIDE